MSRSRLTALIVAYLVFLGALWTWILVAGLEPRLGLDLQGGVSADLIPAQGQGEIDVEVLDQTVQTIRERVDALGVAEPDIARQGDTVQVQLPGVADQAQAREIIGRTAQLQFRPVLAEIPPGTTGEFTPPTAEALPLPSEDALPTEGADPAPEASKTVAQADPTEAPASEEPVSEAPATEEPAAPVDAGATCDERDDLSVPDPDEPVVLCLRTTDANGDELPRDQWARLQLGPATVSGDSLTDARAEIAPGGLGQTWLTALEFDSEGADAFEQITAELACNQGVTRQLAIVLDNVVEQASPMAQDIACGQGIPNGQAVIQVGEEDAAKDLALVLRSGALPIQLDFGTFQTISPTLGEDSLDAALVAGVIGLALVTVYLVVLYRGLGLLAALEIVVGVATIYGLLIVLGELVGFTLTLAGIAGIIISIGIAGDSSIIYRERYRDELRAGRTIRTAAEHAFHNSFRTNFTGAVVSFLAAVVLYFLAVGPVRGFAFTLGMSTIIDVLLFATFTRGMFGLVARSPKLASAPWVGLGAGVTDEQRQAAQERSTVARTRRAGKKGRK
ncbi:protein translocase subunit SecD [Euzebya sp.]|uniref:protein translocase subunit SecD n=1 Tax=Euzebya sp. TaxID=1971409 RepID=UPI003516C980